jgi:hypothetical protein
MRTFVHRPQPIAVAGIGGDSMIQAAPIVADPEHELAVPSLQLDTDVVRSPMLNGVHDRLSSDPHNVFTVILREVFAVCLHMDVNPMATGQFFSNQTQGVRGCGCARR